jgi:predicted nucleic acid-binding protein
MLLEAFSSLNALSIALERINLAEAIALAERTKLSFYDASYLWLALALDAELVTLDDKLARVDKTLRGANRVIPID